MKAVKIAAIAVVTAVLLIGTANVAMARTNVSIGVGIGFPGFYGGYYGGGYSHYYGPWRHHYPYRSEIFIGGPIWGPGYYYPYYYPGYYVVDPPPVVVERPPVVVEQQPTTTQPTTTQPTTTQPTVTQPQGVDENTQKVYKDLRYKKSELLRKLEIGDKDSQIQAIRELAGFSFDDTVRQAIENVLLTNADVQMRLEAAQSLGSVKNTKALPALEKARVDDGDAGVRRAADAAIRNIEGK